MGLMGAADGIDSLVFAEVRLAAGHPQAKGALAQQLAGDIS
jgi:hypothetical protein